MKVHKLATELFKAALKGDIDRLTELLNSQPEAAAAINECADPYLATPLTAAVAACSVPAVGAQIQAAAAQCYRRRHMYVPVLQPARISVEPNNLCNKGCITRLRLAALTLNVDVLTAVSTATDGAASDGQLLVLGMQSSQIRLCNRFSAVQVLDICSAIHPDADGSAVERMLHAIASGGCRMRASVWPQALWLLAGRQLWHLAPYVKQCYPDAGNQVLQTESVANVFSSWQLGAEGLTRALQMFADMYGKPAVLESLQRTTEDQDPPLFACIAREEPALVRALLEFGVPGWAVCTAGRHQGMLPFSLAAKLGNTPIMRCLTTGTAVHTEAPITDHSGAVLHALLSSQQRIKHADDMHFILGMLLRRGLDVELSGIHQPSPLMLACDHGYWTAVQVLTCPCVQQSACQVLHTSS
ncbi:hypothetical protein MMC07_009746, partial [Pseudocyphellaria aurata]|nr:hypothetical protein [Pseudocyphellaria aurata]